MGEVLVVRRLHSIWQSAQASKKSPADSFISKNEGMNEGAALNAEVLGPSRDSTGARSKWIWLGE
jgi:hypothetical protein